MNVLFLTMVDVRDAAESGIYTDLARALAGRGHNVYLVSPAERRHGLPDRLYEPLYCEGGGRVQLCKLRTGNLQKTGLLEKGIATLCLPHRFTRGILRLFCDVRFDLILYSTPPVTLLRPIRVIRRRDRAATYLMLKDIFPQNALDLGMLTTRGLRGLIWRYFRRREKQLYAISDRIGCMSAANVDYLLSHEPWLDAIRVGICPNALQLQDGRLMPAQRRAVREAWGLPQDVPIVVYGGNLGRPQGIEFLIDCLRALQRRKDVYFLLIGEGTEKQKLVAFFEREAPQNARLLPQLPQAQYQRLAGACDVGLILLDQRFTIPNFPSRLLSYLQAGLSTLCCTDAVSDVGEVVERYGCGVRCQSGDVTSFCAALDTLLRADRAVLGERAQACFEKEFSVERACRAVLGEMDGGSEK